MNIAFLVVAGLLAAFALALVVLGLSGPAARAIMQQPIRTWHGLLLRAAFSLALLALGYGLHPELSWVFVVLAVCTLSLVALHWPPASRR